SARNHCRRRRSAGAGARLSGRVRRRRRGEGGTDRVRQLAAVCRAARTPRRQRAGGGLGQCTVRRPPGKNSAPMKSWLGVVGIGEDGIVGISPAARTLIETAEVLVGGARHLAL